MSQQNCHRNEQVEEPAACRLTPRAVLTAGFVPCYESTYLSATVICSRYCCLSRSCDKQLLQEISGRCLHEFTRCPSSVGDRHAPGPIAPSWVASFLPAPLQRSCCCGWGRSCSHRRELVAPAGCCRPGTLGRVSQGQLKTSCGVCSSGAGNCPPHLM